MDNQNKLQIYTDGACSGNPGPGGWGALLMYGNATKEISGFEPDTTNNRMELRAVIEGLKAVKTNTNKQIKVEVYSDSSYIVNAINQNWIQNWQNNGWRNSAKEAIKNQDLWEELIKLNARLKPCYIKVKGHSDNEFNNRCDELARNAITTNVNKN